MCGKPSMLGGVFFFKQKTAYEIKECDWSSDVCSSDLDTRCGHPRLARPGRRGFVPRGHSLRASCPSLVRRAACSAVHGSHRPPGAPRAETPPPGAGTSCVSSVAVGSDDPPGAPGPKPHHPGRGHRLMPASELVVDIVIPARDEAGALPLVLAAIPRAGEGWRVRRVVVVDNGSRDGAGGGGRSGGAGGLSEPGGGEGGGR